MFHERDIRKKIGPFAMLADPATNADFMVDLTGMIGAAPFRSASGPSTSSGSRPKYANPWSPYEIALRFCMERLLNCLQRHEQQGRLVHVIFESRGKNEDADLELEFRRITANQANWGYRSPDFSYARFEPVFARKDANAAGYSWRISSPAHADCGLSDLLSRTGVRGAHPQADRPFRAEDVPLKKQRGPGEPGTPLPTGISPILRTIWASSPPMSMLTVTAACCSWRSSRAWRTYSTVRHFTGGRASPSQSRIPSVGRYSRT